MDQPKLDGKLLWRGAAVLVGTISIAMLAFYGLRAWLDAAPDLIMTPLLPVEEVATAPTGLANPASANCLKQGGTLDIWTGGDGGQIGVCTFDNGSKCEEWAMLRGDCPTGGVAVLQTWDEGELHCAIFGGEVRRENSGLEPSMCRIKGISCPTQAFLKHNGCPETAATPDGE